jgi:hypothetical protein
MDNHTQRVPVRLGHHLARPQRLVDAHQSVPATALNHLTSPRARHRHGVEGQPVRHAPMLVPPLLTALTAAVGVWWKGRQDRRDRDKERHRVLTQVRDEVQVIQAWITAYNTVCADPEAHEEAQMQARKDLDRAYSRLGESLAASRGVH